MFNKKLKQEIQRLQQELNQKNINNLSLSDKINDLTNQIKLLNEENNRLKIILRETDFNKLNNNISLMNDQIKNLLKEITQKKEELKNIKQEILDNKKVIKIERLGLCDLPEDLIYYENKLKEIRKSQADMLVENKYFNQTTKWYVNGDLKQGDKLSKFLANICITSFNLTCDVLLNKLTISNVENIKYRLKRIYDNYNNTLSSNDLQLSSKYFDLKIKELDYRYNIVVKKEQEKEEKQRQKEILKQQSLAEKELQKEKDKLEKELLYYKLQEETGKDVKDKIEEIKNRLERNDYRICHELSGYVYFIVNKSFNNDNWIKIGVTRRLEPYDRIKELSSASVPFKFYPLGIVFTDNAYELENKLHKRLSKYRVNKFNTRKEYFNINVDELEKIVNNEFNLNVHFDRNIVDEDWEYSKK